MKVATLDGIRLHYSEQGDREGAGLVFANSLGTDLRVWDDVVRGLPRGLRVVRYDKRGHGLSEAPPAPYSMDDLVGELAALMDHLGMRETVVVGLSIGGMIAQGLAARRPDLVRAMVLSNTAAKIGTPDMWRERIDAVHEGGIEVLADAVMERWFSAAFRATGELMAWRNMLVRQPPHGYAGCAAAIAGTDFLEETSALRLPTLGLAGSEDGSTPPDMVRETVELIPGSSFHLFRQAGHLPCVEKPAEYAEVLSDFLRITGHV